MAPIPPDADNQFFFGSGEQFWIPPEGGLMTTVWVVGAGGMGGYGTHTLTDPGSAGWGGGGGGALMATVPMSNFGTGDQSVWVGAGGSVVGNTPDERRGGTSTFGPYRATGGFGGSDSRAGGNAGSSETVPTWTGGSGGPGQAPIGESGGLGGIRYKHPNEWDDFTNTILGDGGVGGNHPPFPTGGAGFVGRNGANGFVVVITTLGTPNRYLRMNQRDDGLGIARSPRLAGTSNNGPTSLQRGKPPRLGLNNTYR